MSKKYALILIFTTSALLLLESSCVCVPDINTPKDIVPVVFSKIAFINSISDINAIDIRTKYNDSLDNVNIMDIQATYLKIGAGQNTIKALNTSDKSVIFNSAFYIPQDMFFTYIFYGRNTTIECMTLSDSINNFSSDYSYVRFVNISKRSDKISFRLIKQLTDRIDLDYKQYSNFLKIEPAQYKIEVRDRLADTLFTSISEIQFSAMKQSTLIFKGIKCSLRSS